MEDYATFYSGSMDTSVIETRLGELPPPDTLCIFMTRKERSVRNEVNKAFGNIRRVVIDVDGERHEYDADTLIELLERFEVD